MDTDPYFWTQDNGAGAPVHFATTYRQLDMARGRASLDVTRCLNRLAGHRAPACAASMRGADTVC